MNLVHTSPDLTAFLGSRRRSGWYVGTVDVFQGSSTMRIQHECMPLRDTAVEALRDADSDAKALIRAWRDKVRI